MPRITVTISDALDEYLDEKAGDGSEFDSKSAVMRHLAEQGRDAADQAAVVADLEAKLAGRREEIETLEERAARVDDLETELEQAEARIDVLREQLRVANAKDDRVDELAKYAERQRTTEERWREASLTRRLMWKVTGMPSESSA